MRLGGFLAMLGLVAAIASPPATAIEMKGGAGVAPKGPLNTLRDVQQAIFNCWKWPPETEVRTGLDFSVMLTFRRNGEIYGARITYQSRNVSPEEREMYYRTLMEAVTRCSPLPVSESLGAAIAGRPFNFRFNDNRRERKA